MDIIWWIKLFVLYLAFTIFSFVIWLLTLPIVLFLKRLRPKPVIEFIRKVWWKIMSYILPIGMTAAGLLYLIWLSMRLPLLAITLGIVDLNDVTPFKELIETGIFDWMEALFTLNPVAMYRATWKVLVQTPKLARELFGSEIRKAETTTEEIEEQAQVEIAKRKEWDTCIKSREIAITENMSSDEKQRAIAENNNIRKECDEQHLS